MRAGMRSRIVDLHYFSGTGNTYLVARAMAETLSHAGIETHVIKCLARCPEQANRFVIGGEKVYRAPGTDEY